MKKINLEITKEKVEDKIIDLIGSGSEGQIIISVPSNGEKANFLVLEKRGQYQNEKIKHLQLVEIERDKTQGFVSATINKQGEIDPNLYFLFFHFDFVSQDIFSYVWLIPAKIFFELAEVKLVDGEPQYYFKIPADFKAENKFSRCLLEKNTLGRTLARIFKEGDGFMFVGASLSGILNFKIEDLKKTIVEGRKHCFAGGGAPADNPRLKGSVEREYQKGDWTYQDIYFSGKKNLVGQEVIYYNVKPIWSMVYMGDNDLDEEENDFLKYSLVYLAEKARFGGQGEVSRKGLKYKDLGEGSLESFFGQEILTNRNGKNYQLNYRGGLIEK